jgi:hypothetical protein
LPVFAQRYRQLLRETLVELLFQHARLRAQRCSRIA